MSNYQGPHAAVTQQFVPTPGAVAIEDLPSVAVGTAYDVFAKEVLGSSYSIESNALLWAGIGADKVVYNKDYIDQKAYDFYPVAVYAETPFGDEALEMGTSDVSATGVTIGIDDAYKVPSTEKIVGACEGAIPYYQKDGLSAGDVQIYAADLYTVVITGGALVTARVKKGQKVWINIASTWTYVGVIGSIGNDETKLRLAAPYTAAVTTGEGLIIGATSAALKDVPDTLYDETADFIGNKVRVGDVVYLSTLAIAASVVTPLTATVVSILDKNTLKFNTTALATGSIDSDFTKYKTFAQTPGNTLVLSTYWIERYVGFSQNYQMKTQNSNAGVPVVRVSESSFTYLKTIVTATPIMKIGDIFMVTDLNDSNPVAGVDERTLTPLRLYRVSTIVDGGTTWDVTIDGAIYQSDQVGEVAYVTGDFLTAWLPKIESNIKVDFRAVRSEELGVVKRITNVKDIQDAWTSDGVIDIHNELAYMAQIIFGLNGGKVLYGGNVDASAVNLAAEYSTMLEELKLKDVYSHAFGTTDAGVNALAGPYCDDQADPYEGHERTAIVCYDEDDIYLMGTDTCEVAITGVITTGGTFDPMAAGLTVNDVAKIYDSDGNLVTVVSVIETPTVITSIATDYNGAALDDTHTVRFQSGRKNDQAIKIGAIAYGNRRITVAWPGWFTADFSGDNYTLPPYYITAAIAGMDSGILVAQSFTNMNVSIPGLSNISLGTNHYFRKAQLDEIGGGGIDVFIQDAIVSQSIKSRHDLTSNMDAVEYRERSITKQADVAAKTIRSAIAPYVGKYNITDALFLFLSQVIAIVTTKLLKDGILASLTLASIDRDEVIADKINIVMEATVFVAGNYYDVTLIVKSS